MQTSPEQAEFIVSILKLLPSLEGNLRELTALVERYTEDIRQNATIPRRNLLSLTEDIMELNRRSDSINDPTYQEALLSCLCRSIFVDTELWFGKHKGKKVSQLTDEYLDWFVDYFEDKQLNAKMQQLLAEIKAEIAYRENNDISVSSGFRGTSHYDDEDYYEDYETESDYT